MCMCCFKTLLKISEKKINMLLKIKAYEQSIDKRGNIITGYLKEKIKLTNNQGYK